MAKARDQASAAPPHDEEFERLALGSMLFDREAVSAAAQKNLKPKDFYIRAHEKIFEAIRSIDDDNRNPDITTVIQELKKNGRLDEAGGVSYVSSLTTVIPSSANIEFYVDQVLDYSLRRALLRVASGIGVLAYDESKESPEILNEVERDIFKLSDDRQAFSYSKINTVMKKTIEKISDAYDQKKMITGVPSGFDILDEWTCGFQPSDFIIIGARPSVGKTAFALNMAAHIAFKLKIPTAFFTLEMSDVALTQRLISAEGGIDGTKLKSGYFSKNDFHKIIHIAGKIAEAPFYIVDMPNMQLPVLRSQSRRLRSKEGPGVEIIFIDYLGLITHGGDSKMPQHQQYSEISRALKSLARELEIPIVVLCQLNREAERAGSSSQEPTLANLRDSGSIEQDADIVMFLHKERLKKPKEGEEDKASLDDGISTKLIVAKHRNGRTGVIDLKLRAKYTQFITDQKKSAESESQ